MIHGLMLLNLEGAFVILVLFAIASYRQLMRLFNENTAGINWVKIYFTYVALDFVYISAFVRTCARFS